MKLELFNYSSAYVDIKTIDP